ncbi:uncharacterized protein L969DRAFT_95162 [Mixia osmundae IAM 14324]|uniref:Uncharacterized protein n=1 Tax=Mixia osmundae (strain CBS 9802 / IAM 14324 / JCM 22182 / KY 12970) TaxID=764103 RepID=G7E700_MIXOS|nr:uncharacterized protein L969DRAFT_95162 [Mixia osmundae IAM 14324]KEI39007.1 hypothetical protein L969DRAFT_95162 [Mixia osmundae IAM 14324]GAA98610.1 hypothetical protein E5Q_05297 [Mixia osmundae IAM 14324]
MTAFHRRPVEVATSVYARKRVALHTANNLVTSGMTPRSLKHLSVCGCMPTRLAIKMKFTAALSALAVACTVGTTFAAPAVSGVAPTLGNELAERTDYSTIKWLQSWEVWIQAGLVDTEATVYLNFRINYDPDSQNFDYIDVHTGNYGRVEPHLIDARPGHTKTTEYLVNLDKHTQWNFQIFFDPSPDAQDKNIYFSMTPGGTVINGKTVKYRAGSTIMDFGAVVLLDGEPIPIQHFPTYPPS